MVFCSCKYSSVREFNDVPKSEPCIVVANSETKLESSQKAVAVSDDALAEIYRQIAKNSGIPKNPIFFKSPLSI